MIQRNHINSILEKAFESRITRNVAFWTVFGLFYLINYYTYAGTEFMQSLNFLHIIIIVFSRIFVYGPIVYFNNLILLPHLFEKKKFILYFTIISIVIAGNIFYVKELVTWFDLQIPQLERDSKEAPAAAFLFATSAIVLGFTMSKFATEYFEKKRQEEKLHNETLLSELDMLKSQINPHFLFNALNTIYGLSITNSVQSSNAIMQLSDILRYNLYETNSAKVPLEKEIKYIENYLEFAKLRRNEKARIEYSKKGNFEGLKIAPLLFIPFIENSFKHGLDKNIENGWMNISIKVEEKHLTFICGNSKSNLTVKNDIHSGIGLQNVKRRLDLIYGNKYKLAIKEDDIHYSTILKIELND